MRFDRIHTAGQWPRTTQPHQPVNVVRHDYESKGLRQLRFSHYRAHYDPAVSQVVEERSSILCRCGHQVDLVLKAAAAQPQPVRALWRSLRSHGTDRDSKLCGQPASKIASEGEIDRPLGRAPTNAPTIARWGGLLQGLDSVARWGGLLQSDGQDGRVLDLGERDARVDLLDAGEL
jgi:hypothetical protein